MSVEIICFETTQDFAPLPLRLRKGSKVRFTIGSSSECKKVDLFFNYPSTQSTFNRNVYRQLKWKCKKEKDTPLYYDIRLQIPGVFRYYFANDDKVVGDGYCIVSPRLSLDSGDELPSQAIQCQTFQVDCLGSVDNWRECIQLSYETGFNLLHFTPIQEVRHSPFLITDHFSPSSSIECNEDFEEIQILVNELNKERQMLSVVDVVLHEANEEAAFLKDNPNAAINLHNSPHLRPAYLFDQLLCNLTVDILEGKYNAIGLKKEINCEEHLKKLKILLKGNYVREAKIHELFFLNIEFLVKEFREHLFHYIRGKLDISILGDAFNEKEVKVIQNADYIRNRSRIDVCPFVKKVIEDAKGTDHLCEEWINTCCDSFRESLNNFNAKIMTDVDDQLNAAIENVVSLIHYERVDENGLKLQCVSKTEPLVQSYFTNLQTGDCLKTQSIKQIEYSMYDSSANLHIALRSFHANKKNEDEEIDTEFEEIAFNEYFRRELKVKDHSIKLFYSEHIEDSAFLYNFMTNYVELNARIFHGIVINNVLATPLHALTYFVDIARSVNNDCFIIGEMPHNLSEKDINVINKLGLSAIIRSSMNLSSVAKFASFVKRAISDIWPTYSYNDEYIYLQPRIPVINFVSTPKFNTSNEELNLYHLIASTALTSMSRSAVGSFRGHDELFFSHRDTFYSQWQSSHAEDEIIILRTFLNQLHRRMAYGYNEIYVDEVNDNIIAVSRHNPVTHNSVVLIARTAFTKDIDANVAARLLVPGRINKILLQSTVDLINGEVFVDNEFDLLLEDTDLITNRKCRGENNIDFINFKPGSILILDVSVHATSKRKNSCISEKSIKANKM